ncbi:MAG: DUF4474 domain-containing protein [Bacillota bacterium]|nr:DUF4474 domain-containing protein [Bacillota bacterium]
MCGYAYDPIQDIFISTMNPWQRNVGYCRLYDEAAAPLGMVIDTEPIYFEYQGKKWMIGIWKGQYDMVTGGEIGVYKRAFDLTFAGDAVGTFYNSCSDTELLQMSFILKKKGRTLFTRSGKHWWLTGFMLGEFSEPSELTMEITISFEDVMMRDAFISGLKNAGYSSKELTVTGNAVSFIFDVPHTQQPFTRIKELERIIQRKNQLLCEKYRELTLNFNNLPDKMKATREQAPDLYAKIFNSGKTNSLYEAISTIIRILTYLLSNVSGSGNSRS